MFEQAWRDVLTVVGQTGFIAKCDAQAGIVVAVIAADQTVAVLLVPEDHARSTVFVKLKIDGVSSSREASEAEQLLLDKLSTQLLARHRLQHLLNRQR